MPKHRKISKEDFDSTPELPADIDELEAERDAEERRAWTGERYPHLAVWVFERGWVEIGSDEQGHSLLRVLDAGGLVWESDAVYDSLDAALADADAALADMEEAGEI